MLLIKTPFFCGKFTIMVNNSFNVSAHEGVPPVSTEKGRFHIDGGSLYDKSTVLTLLEKGDAHMQLWTRKCIRDVQSLAFEIKDVRALLKLALLNGR